jgi:hypothetical protein
MMPRPCDFLHNLLPEGQCHWCDMYRNQPAYRALWDSVPSPAGLPGTELRKLLNEFGAMPKEGCQCVERAIKMDEWGPDGCKRHKAEIVEWLEGEWKRLGLWERLRIAGRAISVGFLHPLDPAGALVDESIKRAETKILGGSGRG